MSSMKEYDYIVIGAGSGGIASARRAALHGKKVLLVEKQVVGGTCVNRGCVPKKVCFNLAHIIEQLKLGADYGLANQSNELDYKTFVEKRDAYISRLQQIYNHNLAKSDVTTIRGQASFTGTNRIQVNGEHYTSENILIAVGGEPQLPQIEGHEYVETSDDFFQWKELPDSVAIVGSGYIACELAGVLRAFGVKVSILYRGEKLVSAFPEFLGTRLAESYEKQKIELLPKTTPGSIHSTGNKYQIQNDAGQVIGTWGKILWATGRNPLTADLNLSAAKIQCDSRGYVVVDPQEKTSNPGVYAVGDVTGHALLTPYAIDRGRALADFLFNGNPFRTAPAYIPTVMFSHPPIASVGLSKEAAEEKYGADEIKCYSSQFRNMLFALSEEKPVSEFQLVTLGSEEKVIGVHLFGHAADEILQGIAVAMNAGARKKDFDDTLAIHPTAAEEIVLMT